MIKTDYIPPGSRPSGLLRYFRRNLVFLAAAIFKRQQLQPTEHLSQSKVEAKPKFAAPNNRPRTFLNEVCLTGPSHHASFTIKSLLNGSQGNAKKNGGVSAGYMVLLPLQAICVKKRNSGVGGGLQLTTYQQSACLNL